MDDNMPLLLTLFILVTGVPLVTLFASFFTEPSQEAPEPREPLFPDGAYPSTWLAPGWNRKFVRAPINCSALMELYTTSVRFLREKDWTNASLYTDRIQAVLEENGITAPCLEANIQNNLGVIAYYIGSADKAQERFQSALDQATNQEEHITIASAARNLSAVLLFKKDFKAAQDVLDVAKTSLNRLYGEGSNHLVDITCIQTAIEKAQNRKRR